ncbi:hypothetical protein LIER_07744 [Lithospermum erythrorhizon]|uniref:Integrase zinc-binding domain-containing protein n=1 Tax=Lithospermum erythrorhizon TaxID=34254 RepID=A0AAV3P9Y1_LITER
MTDEEEQLTTKVEQSDYDRPPIYHEALEQFEVVNVVDDNKPISHFISPGFEWKIQEHRFTFTVRILPLGACQMVVGVEWLQNHSLVQFNFHKMQLTLLVNTIKLTLQAVTSQGDLQLISTKNLTKWIKHSNAPMISQLFSFQTTAFASHVILVKKIDGTWRFRVDYRYLNELTIKHDFPIPIVDDLLDELQALSCWPYQWFSHHGCMTLQNLIQDGQLQHILAGIVVKPVDFPLYDYKEGILRYKQRIMLDSDHQLWIKIMEALHDSTVGGHSSIASTYERVNSLFCWKGMKKDILTYVSSYTVCQQSKHELVSSLGLLQPIHITSTTWTQISMNFIKGLPTSS